jgi:toxin ParE1/3/4
MSQVNRTAAAANDLLDIWTYIATHSPGAANRVLRQIDQDCSLLAEFPDIGAHRDELAAGLRSFPRGNYVIFYRPVAGGIEVIRVLHGARDIRPELFNP